MWLAVALVVALAAETLVRFKESSSTNVALYRIAVSQVGDINRAVSATGTLQPWATVDIKSKAGGRVNELNVDIGSPVKRDQIIARIDPTDSLLTFEQAKADTDSAKTKESQSHAAYQLQVAQSQAMVNQAKAGLGAAQANVNAATARRETALEQFSAQPSQTAAAIAQSQANYDSEIQARAQMTETQAQDRAGAKASHDQALATDRNAQAYLARVKDLYLKGFVAAVDLDQAQTNADVSAAALSLASVKSATLEKQQQAAALAEDAKVRQVLELLRSARAQVDLQTRRSALDESLATEKQAAAQADQARAQLAQAVADLASNQISALDIATAHAGALRAEAGLSNAQTTLDQTVVRAPSAGVVLQKYVEAGTIITSGLSVNSTGTSIVQLGDVTRLYVYALVDETDIGSVKVGQHVHISVDAYPGLAFEGVVSRIDPQAQVQQNVTSVGVRVEVDNSNKNFGLLKPNLNATCDFVIAEKRSALWIPADAVQSDAGGSFVLVVTGAVPRSENGGAVSLDKSVLRRRSIQVGFRGDDSIEVVAGIRKGESVIVQAITASSTSAPQARGAVGGMGPRGGR